jgi:hypothetical protein
VYVFEVDMKRPCSRSRCTAVSRFREALAGLLGLVVPRHFLGPGDSPA